METLVLVIHVLASIGLIGLILLQHGKGADMGAAFGSGASGSLFGASGSSNFMSHATAVFVTIFFITSLSLAHLAGHRDDGASVIKIDTDSSVVQQSTENAAPAGAGGAEDVPQ